MTNMLEHDHRGLECPKCGKRVLVEHDPNKYKCLWCGFRRNANDGFWRNGAEETSALGFIASALIATLLLLLML